MARMVVGMDPGFDLGCAEGPQVPGPGVQRCWFVSGLNFTRTPVHVKPKVVLTMALVKL